MAFSVEEIAYVRSQPLAHVAMVSVDGQPDAVPVAFEFDVFHLVVKSFAPEWMRRTRNIEDVNCKVAFVIDDRDSQEPWSPRYLHMFDRAECVDT
jgi:pyridoxamine 5'-phosphate oxidase family protein